MKTQSIPTADQLKKELVHKLKGLKHDFVRVNDIVIPEEMMHPIKFNDPIVNFVFSELGGLIPSQVIFMTGEPGAGKTTICSKLGAILEHENSPVFLSLEMSDFQLVLQAKKIDGFEKYYIVRSIDDLDSLMQDLAVLQPSLVVLDSIQELASKLYGGRDKDQIDIVNKFTEFAKSTFIPVILIGHCTKSGTYKGPTTLLHKVDTHLHVFIEKDSGDRYFSIHKNRMGGNATAVPFRITGDAVIIGSHYEEPDETDAKDVMQVLKSYRAQVKGKSQIELNDVRDLIHSIYNHLRRKYEKELVNDSVKESATFRIKFEEAGLKCFCEAYKNQITFSTSYIKALRDGNVSGYAKEHAVGKRWTHNERDERIIWTILHEFTHLFKGYQHHKKSFFQKLESFAAQNAFLFTHGEEALAEYLSEQGGNPQGLTYAVPVILKEPTVEEIEDQLKFEAEEEELENA